MFKIEKKLPIPKANHTGAKKYPWREMAVGDSFFVPTPVKTATMRGQASMWGIKLKGRFTVRDVEGGVRVWRVK